MLTPRGRPRTAALALVAMLAAGPLPAAKAEVGEVAVADAYARIEANELTLGTAAVERVWSLQGPVTTISLRDLRTGREYADAGAAEFRIRIGGLWLEAAFAEATLWERDGAAGATITMALAPGIEVIREHAVRPGADSFHTHTEIRSSGPALSFDGFSLLDLALPPDWATQASGEAVAFHGGSAKRQDHAHHSPLEGSGQEDLRAETAYLGDAEGAAVLLWSGRHGNAGNRVVVQPGEAATTFALRVEYTRELLELGPVPPQRVGNPAPEPLGVRRRTLRPGESIRLPESALILAAPRPAAGARTAAALALASFLDARSRPFRHEMTYNGFARFGVGGNSGPMNEARLLEEIEAAAAAGVETFVLDAGWQDVSGDWNPDPVRLPNGFGPLAAAAEEGGMRLGVWMSPLHFGYDSEAFRQNPTWATLPWGATEAYRQVCPTLRQVRNLIPQPYRNLTPSVFCPGQPIGVWSPADPGFRAHLTAVIDRLVSEGLAYFKWDFQVWVDDLNPQHPGDMYDYFDAYLSLLDEIAARHPDATFQPAEGEEGRLFANAAMVRGPSAFHSGPVAGPNQPVARKADAIAQLAPFFPPRALALPVLPQATGDQNPAPLSLEQIDRDLAVGLLSHATFWRGMAWMDEASLARARAWTDLYRENRALFSAPVVLPLLQGDPAAFQTHDLGAGSGIVVAVALAGDWEGRLALEALDPTREYLVEELRPDQAPMSLGIFSGGSLTGAGLPLELAADGVRVLRVSADEG